MANFLPFYIITILVFLSFFASAAYSHFILIPKERRRGDARPGSGEYASPAIQYSSAIVSVSCRVV